MGWQMDQPRWALLASAGTPAEFHRIWPSVCLQLPPSTYELCLKE